jgi:glycolate oxidase iron-sulfur subunit
VLWLTRYSIRITPPKVPPLPLLPSPPARTSLAARHLPLTPVESLLIPIQTMSVAPIPGLNPIYEDYARCIHCGLCLNACPTYRLWNLEADSPRGRIHQMIHVELNQQPITDSFVDHIDKCFDCRACETACPSGVEYGKLVEHARARIERDSPRSWLATVTRNFVFRHLLPDPHRIIDFARVIRIYQRSGLQTIARGIGILKLLGLAERERLLPRIDDNFFYRRFGWTFPAAGPRRARVAFFAGCVANVTFSQLNEATIRVLTANGCEVVIPSGQLCCGALAAHAGVRDAARELARKNFSVFLREDFDAIITNAAGCGSTLKEYHHLFSPGESEHAQAGLFAARTRDVTEFLAAFGLTAKMKPLPIRVTYQDSCHLLHGQKIREAPRTLLRAIPDLDFVELPYSEICCGSAGVYNVTQTETSLELLAEKMRHAQSTGAQTIVTANPGCLLQLRAGAAIHRTNQEVLHVVELLDRAMVSACVRDQ